MVPAIKKCILIYCLTASVIPYGLNAWGKPKQKMARDSRYKINFHQVKAEEFIQFLSEIANLNFVYNPGDLNFTINLVSDEEMTLETIVSGFVQTLRIQGYSILEENGTLLIHRNPDIKELPTLYSPESRTDSVVSPIVTKIYQIKNSPVEAIRDLIVPFLSTASVMEVFSDRKLLIISDVVQNILSIDSLIKTIDQPETGSTSATYHTNFFTPQDLINIANPIIQSVCGGKSYSLLPQDNTQRVFIVGSEELIDKTLEIFSQIEERATKNPSSITSGNILLHKALHRPIQSLASAVKMIAKDSKRTEFNTASFIKLANEASFVYPDFLLYIGEPVELKKIEELIKTIDTAQQVKSDSTFSIIKLQYQNGKVVLEQLKSMMKDIPDTGDNADFLDALATIRWNKQTNSIVVQGSNTTIQEIAELISKIDVQNAASNLQQFIYRPKTKSPKDLIEQIKMSTQQVAANDPNFAQMITNLHVVDGTIVTAGNPDNIQKLQQILDSFDQSITATSSQTFTIIKLQNVSGKFVMEQLTQMSKTVNDAPENSAFLSAIRSLQWNKTNNTLTIRGTPAAVQQVGDLISKLDVHTISSTQYFIYKPTHMTAQEMLRSLQGIGHDLENSGVADASLLQTINGTKLVKNSDSLIVSGSETNLTKVKEMIVSLDQQGTQPTAKIAQIGNTTFLSYRPKVRSAKDLLEQLKISVQDVKKQDPDIYRLVNNGKIIEGALVFSGPSDDLDKIGKLLDTLDQRVPGEKTVQRAQDKYQNYKPVYQTGLDLIKETQGYVEHVTSKGLGNRSLSTTAENLQFINGRIVIVGSQDNVDQIMKLLQEFDTPVADLSRQNTTIESFDNIGFLNYKLNFHLGSDIQAAIKQIGDVLQLNKNQKNEALINSISSIQWIKVTNSLIATGDPQTLAKLKEILENIDIPLKQVFIEILVIETSKSNSLDIGLRWGGFSNFKGRLAGIATNAPRVDATNNIVDYLDLVKGAQPNSAGSSSSGVNAQNGPAPNLFPSVTAGQLGIIGDIIFHGGKSYLTLASLLTALQEEGTITVVLNQKIMAQDSRMSQIFVGQNIPFTGSIITTSGISQTTNANLEYRNIGVSLNITPNIGDNGIVTIEIDEEITEEQNTGTTGGGSVNTQQVTGIRTSKTSMQTRVHVPDKAFVVLSGQIRNTKTRTKSGLPCLGGLPVVGAAFQQSSSVDVANDVIIFIRPEIIQTSDQWKDLSEQQSETVKSQADAESYDKGIDLIKDES